MKGKLLRLFFIWATKICIVIIPIYFGIGINILQQFNFFNQHENIINIIFMLLLLLALMCEGYIQYKCYKNKKHYKLIKAYRSFISGYFDDKLREISNDLGYAENERLTLFLYSSSQNAFYSIGRYSKSPKYNQIGRYVIDNQDEYVFAVINEKEHYDKSRPIKNKWFKLFSHKIKMQSNDMYGVYIEEKGMKIGVVIAQTMKPNKFNNKTERNKLKKKILELQSIIIEMNINPNVLPSENDLTEKGL